MSYTRTMPLSSRSRSCLKVIHFSFPLHIFSMLQWIVKQLYTGYFHCCYEQMMCHVQDPHPLGQGRAWKSKAICLKNTVQLYRSYYICHQLDISEKWSAPRQGMSWTKFKEGPTLKVKVTDGLQRSRLINLVILINDYYLTNIITIVAHSRWSLLNIWHSVQFFKKWRDIL